MKVVCIGAGIGSLLTGAYLAKGGFSVEVFEKLPRIGGRFYNLPYKGYTLSTGALHLLPHGDSGPMGRMLKKAGVQFEVVKGEPPALLRVGKSYCPFENFYSLLPIWDRVKIGTISLLSRIHTPNVSFKDWFYPYTKNELVCGIADSFCGWSFSLMSSEVPARHVLKILHNISKYGMPGVVVGGCSSICDGLASVIESEGGSVHTRSEVKKILVRDGRVCGVLVGNNKVEADIVVSNIGHDATAKLLDGEMECATDMKPSEGIKFCISPTRTITDSPSIVFTPHMRVVCGLVDVSLADPSFAPEGKSLIMAHGVPHSPNL